MIYLAIAVLLFVLSLAMESYAISPDRERKRGINQMADASRKRQEQKRTWPRL